MVLRRWLYQVSSGLWTTLVDCCMCPQWPCLHLMLCAWVWIDAIDLAHCMNKVVTDPRQSLNFEVTFFHCFFHCCALQRKNWLLNLFGHCLWLTICNMSVLRKRYVGCQLFKIVHCCTRNNTVCRQHWAGSCWWLPSDCCCSLKPGNTLEEVWESPGKQAFGVCRTLYRVTRII